MNTFPAGTDVSVAFPLNDLVPTGLSFVVQGQSGNVLASAQQISITPGMEEAVVVVPAALNTLINPVEARVVVLTVQTATRSVEFERIYLVARRRKLVLMENSFQTLAEAHAGASLIPNLLGWSAADDNSRASAMIEAFLRLRQLGYRIRHPDPTLDTQSLLDYDDTRTIEPYNWPLITPELWLSNRYPEAFRAAMRRAQIVESNELLRGDRVNEKRRAGIMSESIGESSMMFRMDKPLDLGVSQAALRCLQGYVQIRVTLARSS